MDFNSIISRFNELKEKPYTVHPKIRGVIIGMLDKACHSKENRYLFSIALGCSAHSKDWTNGEWYAMSQICKVDKNPATGWVSSNPNFEKIIGLVMTQTSANEAQAVMNFDAPEIQPVCGHPVTSVIQADEGTAYCGECADDARYHGQDNAI